MTPAPPEDTALLIVCPAAEEAVEGLRLRFDRAAQFGVPAHVTITYPFKPRAELTDDDRATLRMVVAGFRSRSRVVGRAGSTTRWCSLRSRTLRRQSS